MKTVVIGIGNRVLTDDAVGCIVAERVGRNFESLDSIAWREVSSGGLLLMEAMVDFDRAVLIDAIETRRVPPGTIISIPEGRLTETRNSSSSHDGTLREALAFGRQAGRKLPVQIRIWAIEAGDVTRFSECLTLPVENAAAQLAERITKELREESA